jgi:hypothetical protein
MSKELIGHGEIVGSPAYFNKLNNAGFLKNIISDPNGYDYYGSIEEVSEKINRVFNEIFEDLKSNIAIVRYIPKDRRDQVINLIRNLGEVGKITSSPPGNRDHCISILQLSSALTRQQSSASENDVNKALNVLKNGGFAGLPRDNSFDLINKAINGGLSGAIKGNESRKEFFTKLSPNAQLPGQAFLRDVFAKGQYVNNPNRYQGKCGKALCSGEYQDYVIQAVFGKPLPRGTKFAGAITEACKTVVRGITRDLDAGALRNDYLRDENAKRLKDALKELERCRISVMGLQGKIDKLCWFVGGDPAKIVRLQHLLNALEIQGPSGRLVEDGVYGKQTFGAWETFFNNLAHGPVPSLNWVNPLQSNLTNVYIGSSDKGINNVLKKGMGTGGVQYLRVDPPHFYKSGNPRSGYYRGKKILIDYNHINLFDQTTNDRQINIKGKYNHYPLSDGAYDFLKNFDDAAKKIKVAGKVLLIAGIVLDTLELGLTVYDDLTDADEKLGKKSISTAARIGGRWAGSLGGAKLGAMAGSAIGTAIAPGIGTIIGGAAGGLILGIAGAFAGDKLAEWVVDITVTEE